MSDRGSPSDRTVADTTAVDGAAPAGAAPGAAVADAGSGDANLSDAASSAVVDKGAIKDQPKPTLADVIKTAASLDDNGKSPIPAKDGTDKTKVEGDTASVKAEGEKADDKDLPFHNHPRWKEVTGQNKALTERVAALEPNAQQFGKITEFMTQHTLTPDEVGEGFIIMAMLKAGDPRGLVKLDEYRDKLATVLGEKIPADIQEQIDSGAITDTAGKELSKARAGKAKSDAETARLRTADTERQRTQDATDLATKCQSGVTAWEVEARKTDPDFAKKESAIARYSRALMQEKGFPKTSEQAVQIVKDAYAEVNKDFAAAIPPKGPSRHVPSAPSSHGAKPAPKTLAEAVRQAASL